MPVGANRIRPLDLAQCSRAYAIRPYENYCPYTDSIVRIRNCAPTEIGSKREHYFSGLELAALGLSAGAEKLIEIVGEVAG